MKLSLFHNPKCSKSREALQLLKDKGIDPEIILYLKTPPSESELKDIVAKLNLSPKELLRFKEAQAMTLGLSFSDARSDKEWIKLMCDYPILIERPILITSGKAIIGRPPERIFDLI